MSFLEGIRVLELADELGEYCGKVLAGLGADVIKVEPPDGEPTRRYGPFRDDSPDPNQSLYFWHYNFGKRGITLDLDTDDGCERLRNLAATADVVIDTRRRGYLAERGLGYDALHERHPTLIVVRITPFGDDGPWADYQASDLIHLALGGMVMNCGYDPDPLGEYDTPPVAPQMWQAYQIAGEMGALGALGALNHRLEMGAGQQVSVSVHQAVAANQETDVPNWIYQRAPHRRQTCRHSLPQRTPPAIAMTKDGRWLLPYRTYLPPSFGDPFVGTLELLSRYGMQADLADDRYQDPGYRAWNVATQHIGSLTDALVGSFLYERDLWREAQELGLTWGPLRKPGENATDDHLAMRGSIFEVEHPELDSSVTYVGAKWYCADVPWRRGPRAPMLGEHNAEVLGEIVPRQPALGVRGGSGLRPQTPAGTPFALTGVRIVDLSWLLASGGAGRFLTSLGAEVIKVEHVSRVDALRYGAGYAPDGGRAERVAATAPIPDPESPTINQCGMFSEINAGKRSLSLNLKTERGKELLTQLLATADMVTEGFSPGTMDRLGFGYERLKEINPRLVYVQQSGMGQRGTYGRMRSYGPTAQAFSGLSEMSGLPEPFPPAGIGFSYLDWFGAYNLALGMLAALYRQRTTGKGCWIDSSQLEAGLYLTGTPILDFTVNGRGWHRRGNRSPDKPAAPHGVFPVAGRDAWIAIACFTEGHWRGLEAVLGRSWESDPRFASLAARLQHQDELEALVADATRERDGEELMGALQAAGVPAGVCQRARELCERDPQLRHLRWTREIRHSEIGTWPIREVPIRYSDTPGYIGGIVDRAGPCYGEDNGYVLGELLGLDDDEQQSLASEGVL